MISARKKMLDRIRAMLNTGGRTEAEMMAFLAKARELMATYEIDESELKEEAEKAEFHKTGMTDPYEIKKGLCTPVGNFTRCRGFNGTNHNWGICFVGLESDVIFATWLLDTLQRFVMRALRAYQQQRTVDKMSNSNHTSASFVIGCVSRIAEKLKQLTPIVEAKHKAIIEAELARNGIALVKAGRGKAIDQNVARAGYAAGNSARFDRPVESGGKRMLK